MNRLEYFGRGGWITSHVAGKTVDHLEKDGIWLILVTTCGHRYRIGWQDNGNQLKGEPFLENLDVRILIEGAGISGKADM